MRAGKVFLRVFEDSLHQKGFRNSSFTPSDHPYPHAHQLLQRTQSNSCSMTSFYKSSVRGNCYVISLLCLAILFFIIVSTNFNRHTQVRPLVPRIASKCFSKKKTKQNRKRKQNCLGTSLHPYQMCMDAKSSFSFCVSSVSSLSTLFTSQSSVSPTDILAGFLLLLSLKIILLHGFMSSATCSSRYAFQRTYYGFSFYLPDVCSYLLSLFG